MKSLYEPLVQPFSHSGEVRRRGILVYLSGTGADEIISDYGHAGPVGGTNLLFSMDEAKKSEQTTCSVLACLVQSQSAREEDLSTFELWRRIFD